VLEQFMGFPLQHESNNSAVLRG